MNNDVSKGLDVIWSSGDIAIVVLMVVLLLSLTMNGVLLRGLLSMKDVLNSLLNAVSLLNERLDHNHVTNDKKPSKRSKRSK